MACKNMTVPNIYKAEKSTNHGPMLKTWIKLNDEHDLECTIKFRGRKEYLFSEESAPWSPVISFTRWENLGNGLRRTDFVSGCKSIRYGAKEYAKRLAGPLAEIAREYGAKDKLLILYDVLMHGNYETLHNAAKEA